MFKQTTSSLLFLTQAVQNGWLLGKVKCCSLILDICGWFLLPKLVWTDYNGKVSDEYRFVDNFHCYPRSIYPVLHFKRIRKIRSKDKITDHRREKACLPTFPCIFVPH